VIEKQEQQLPHKKLRCPCYYIGALSSNILIIALQGGYRGFYARNTINLTPKSVNDIHKRGGTILGSSRGGHDTMKIVDSIQYRGINQVKWRKAISTDLPSAI
jgi:6-phosphofructokinase